MLFFRLLRKPLHIYQSIQKQELLVCVRFKGSYINKTNEKKSGLKRVQN